MTKKFPDCTRCNRPNRRGGRTKICAKCLKESPNKSVRLAEPPTEKLCSRCRETKPADQFYKNKARPDWLSVYCRPCHSEKAAGEYELAGPERARDRRLHARYGISLKEYNELLEGQGGVCALCGRPPNGKSFHVDHSHEPPYSVRGILCYLCNKHKVGALTIREVDKVSQYLHNPPAHGIIGVRIVPTGMEKGESRRSRRRGKVKPDGD